MLRFTPDLRRRSRHASGDLLPAPSARLAALLLAAVAATAGCTKAPSGPPDEAVRRLNVGIAYLEQHSFLQAEKELVEAVKLDDRFVEAHVDLGIVYAAQIKHAEALAELQKALALEPANPHALYMTALIYKYQGEKDLAIAAFEKLRTIDADDPDTKYTLAVLYRDGGDYAKAIPLLEDVVRSAPYFASAYYALGQTLIRQGQVAGDLALTATGKAHIEQFQRLSGGPAGETTGLRYGEQGRYALALENRSLPPALPPVSLRFTESAKGSGLAFTHGRGAGLQASLGSGVLVFDLDSDGDEDVLLLGSADGLAARLLRNDGKGSFVDTTDAAGLGAIRGASTGVAAGDADNDGAPDLLLAGRLFKGGPAGVFTDATAASGLEGKLEDTAAMSFVDLDHDGDLDVAVALPGGGGVRTFRNDRSADLGTFTEVTEKTGLGGFKGVSLVFADVDADRDVDALVGIDGNRPRLFSNNRELSFTDVGEAAGFADRGGATPGVAAQDVDGDDFPDLVVAGASGVTLYRNRRDRTFAPTFTAAGSVSSPLLLDADLDGDLDLVLGGGEGLRYFRNDGRGGFTDDTRGVGFDAVRADVRGLASGDLDGDGDLDLVANVFGAPALLLVNGVAGAPGSPGWVRIDARGLGSNKTALGTKIEVRAARLHQRLEVQGASGFLSQSSPTASFGLGPVPGLDRVRLLWPGGVLQAELGLAPGRIHTVTELDRKGSSCPFLWAWDGERMAFVSDIQGGSPLGLWIADGLRNLPDPDEWFLLPEGIARPRDGSYDLRITESLEEIAYLDRAMLRVVDAPADVAVFPNERLLLAPPFASYGLHFIKRTVAPVAATTTTHDGESRDVREALASIDRRFAGALRPTPFKGFAEPWSLELDFGTLTSADRTGPVVLLAHGYVEFSNSTPIYAASQAGLHFALPALDVLDDSGAVHATLADAGAPAGLPKWMVLELTGRIPSDGRVRLRYRTNMEVYFDQVLLGIEDPATPHRVTDLEAVSADLRHTGYPSLWSPDGGRPVLYRYDGLLADETWTSQEGLYTRFGDVRDLLAREDDRLVVMSHGDELALRFPEAGAPPPGPGEKRSLILFTVGYAKDLDGRSASPWSVGPLPYRAMKSYPYAGAGPFADPAFAASLEPWSTRYIRPRCGVIR